MAAADRVHTALRAAQLYYLQTMTMAAVADELGVSRSSVSRLLAFCRETGLVDIRVNPPLDQLDRLADELGHHYAVAWHIVPVPDRTSDVDRLDRVAMSAARLLGGFFDSNMTIGIAWGSTMSAVSRHLVAKRTHNSMIVQLNGAANYQTTGIPYASEILGRFGTAFEAKVQQFAVPAFFDDPVTKQALWRERSIRRVLALQRRMDIAIFGLGSPTAEVPSHVFAGGYLGKDDFRQLSSQGVVGDVATVFYREDGSDADLPLNARSSGPELARLRRVARRVCVVSGASKVHALRGALAARLPTDVVVDEVTARVLVEDET